MSIPYNAMISGTFTSNGSSQTITVPNDIVKLDLFNTTYFGSTAATTQMETASWVLGLPDASAYLGSKTNGAATIQLTNMISSNGFTLLDRSGPEVGNPVAIATITNASPMVVATANTAGLSSGDVVRLYASSASSTAHQDYGRDYTIGTIVANTSFQLVYSGAAPGAAEAVGAFYRKVNYSSLYYPRRRFISNITQAAQAVITMTVTHNLTAGQLVRIYCPSSWGMQEINGLQAKIVSVNTGANTITVDIDSSAFTAFAYPSNAVALASVDQPQVVPIGEVAASPYQNSLDDATVNQGQIQMSLGSSVVGASNDVIRWIAYRAVQQ